MCEFCKDPGDVIYPFEIHKVSACKGMYMYVSLLDALCSAEHIPRVLRTMQNRLLIHVCVQCALHTLCVIRVLC